MEFVHEIEGALSIRRALHIHPYKSRRIHGRGFGNQSAHDIPRHPLIHVQAHMCELQADVGLELIGGDRIEDLLIEQARFAALRRGW